MNNAVRLLGYRGRLPARAENRGARRMMRYALSLLCLLLLAHGASLVLSGCASNLATGERHLNLISESQEVAMGQEADGQVIASLGLYPDSALQRYVQALGAKLAGSSERPNLPWTFRVIDDPAVNAFAIPGGFIYVTRGLMAYMMNEAELSSVIGHEIGHVTAQHSVHRISEQQLTQVGIAGALKAEHLGLRYMIRAGNDPREMIDVFDMLGRVSSAGGGGRAPEWLATHPNPENRSGSIQKEIDTLAFDLGSLAVNKNGYLRLIDGVVFGQNPREGFFRDNHFYHPELEFELGFPSGWQTVNQKNAVVAVSPNQDAVIQISMAKTRSASEAARTFFQQEGVQSEREETSTVNGLNAVSAQFRAQSEQQVLRGRVSFVELQGNTYQLLGYASEQLWPKYQDVITTAVRDFRRLTNPSILQMQPMRLAIINVSQRVSLEQLAQQERSPVLLETLAIINQTEANARFNAGDRVKIVRGEKLVFQAGY
ncbi:MAG: M48 family metalloprotease [candidate division Zixibacteria bacterium]|nr:M48 family metalloprotease [candidate division Zixibacteria bacterium]